MLRGFVDQISRQVIEGWAADDARPDQTVDVCVFVNGRKFALIPCDRFRRDLLDSGEFGQGNHGFRFFLPERLLSDVECRVAVAFDATGERVPGGYRALPVRWAASMLRPVLVTAPARSGTTALMGLLSHSPGICIADVHPFEVRMLTYYWTVYRTLIARGDPANSTNPADLIKSPHFVGSNPFSGDDYLSAFKDRASYQEVFSGTLPEALMRAVREVIQGYYGRLAEDREKQGAVFFAEKRLSLAPDVRDFACDLFGELHEIILIRDPRDILASRLAYFALDPKAAIEEITIDCGDLLNMKRGPQSNALFVAYEAMVTDPARVCADLERHLGVQIMSCGYDPIEAGNFQTHATSASPQASVGRWRHDLTDAQKCECNETWREFLVAFSYGE